jgi:putative phage-type endonuclease
MKIHNLKQGTDEWLQIRKEKVTGSKFSRAISNTKATRLGLIKELIEEKYANVVDDGYKSPSMTRGTDEEKYAVQAYVERYGDEVEVVGICEHDEFDWLMFSPDRYTDNRETYLEFKCPDSTTMIEYMLDKKLPSTYKAQILLSFIVNEKQKKAKLIAYDARFKEYNHQMIVFEVTREELQEDINKALEILAIFKTEWEAVDNYYKNLIF